MLDICLECNLMTIVLIFFLINCLGAFIIYKTLFYLFETKEERDFRKGVKNGFH
jgi:hypothetical protein